MLHALLDYSSSWEQLPCFPCNEHKGPFNLVLTSTCFCVRQSLDSGCDMMGLKERIQKSQEECEKREERFLQTQTLQQTGDPLEQTHWRRPCLHLLLMVILSVKFRSHGVKLEQLALISHTWWRTLFLFSASSAVIISFFRHGRRGGDDVLRRSVALYHRHWLLLSGVCPQGRGPLPSVESSGEDAKFVHVLVNKCAAWWYMWPVTYRSELVN